MVVSIKVYVCAILGTVPRAVTATISRQEYIAGYPSDIRSQPLVVLRNWYVLQDINISSVSYKNTFH